MRAAVVAVALSLSATAACGRGETKHKPLPPDRAEELLHERVWLDRLPRTMNEKFHVAFFDENGAAIAQHRSVWKGDFELFFHEVEGGELGFFLPASGTKMHSTFHVEPLPGHEQADLKLVIDHPPIGPREYIGLPMEGHGGADVATIDAWLAQRFATAP